MNSRARAHPTAVTVGCSVHLAGYAVAVACAAAADLCRRGMAPECGAVRHTALATPGEVHGSHLRDVLAALVPAPKSTFE